jgi:cell division protein FtsN
VGLLTLAFVMGVQVGKQSAALRRPATPSGEEDLRDLPEPLVDQLKVFAGDGSDKLVPTAQKVDASAPQAAAPPAATPSAATPPLPSATEDDSTWTLQLVSTADVAEAKRVAGRAKEAGFATTTTHVKGQYKVRLAASGDRAAMDQTAGRLKKAGFKPFAVKVEQ